LSKGKRSVHVFLRSLNHRYGRWLGKLRVGAGFSRVAVSRKKGGSQEAFFAKHKGIGIHGVREARGSGRSSK